MMGNALRGAVASKYGSCARFATAIGWSSRKTNDIVSGRQEPNASEICKMAKSLDLTEPEPFMKIFFPDIATKCGN